MARIIRKAGYQRPSRSDVHVNRPLSNISLAFVQADENFVAAKTFQTVPVDKQSDAYFTYDRGDWNRDEMAQRAPSTESRGITYGTSTDTYYAKVYALHRDIDDQIRANADDPINLDRDATELLTLKALISREVTWAATYFVAGAWSWEFDGVASSPTAPGSLDPTADGSNNVLQWNDGSSTPIEDVRFAKRYMLQQTGFMPNTLTLGRPVYDYLVDHPDIVGRLDRGQTSGVAKANKDALAALFEVNEIAVMDSIKNTAKQGATASHSFIGGKHALLSYKPPRPGLMTPAAGYTFSWTGLFGSSAEAGRVSRFRMDAIKSDRVEIEMSWDMKKVSAALGFFFEGIVA